MMSRIHLYKDRLAIGTLALFNVLVHLWVYDNLEFHRDELLYFSLGIHPAFGYATVPPLIGWIASLMQLFFGYSLFAVKLFPALLGGALVVFSTKISKELGGGFYAQVLTGISIVLLPVAMRAFHLFQPVPLDLFFWTLFLYYTLRFVNTENKKYLWYLGVVGGVALLNKYLIVLLFLSLLFSIVFSAHKSIFRNRSFYGGVLIGMLIFL
ncbi:MAG: glycosyltransferase family 39 protein, partial [Flavobacteriaceae bacterium]